MLSRQNFYKPIEEIRKDNLNSHQKLDNANIKNIQQTHAKLIGRQQVATALINNGLPASSSLQKTTLLKICYQNSKKSKNYESTQGKMKQHLTNLNIKYSQPPSTNFLNLLKNKKELQCQLFKLKQQMKEQLDQEQRSLKLQEISKKSLDEVKLAENTLQKQIELQRLQQDKLKKEGTILVEQYQKIKKQSNSLYELKKRYNNQLQEAKGNIRVYCRIRPFSQIGRRSNYQIIDSSLTILKDKGQLKSKNQISDYTFVFQKIFDEHATQENIFDQTVDLIQSSVDGKNVCIFAYGQTGSGKTYTMKGLEQSIQKMGFIPRSLQRIFQQVELAKQKNFLISISVSILQIYNEKVYDLLAQKREKQSDIKNKQFTQISKFQDGLCLLNRAMKNRTTAGTEMNQQSSRSHLLFTVKNSFTNGSKNRTSSLVMVDLAGSERINESKVTGERMKEATFINKSLTELGKLMRAIKAQQPPIFRNSKLTLALQEFLEGDGKAVMFVNVSPDAKDEQQTINSLKFAEGVRQCKIMGKR